MKQCCDHSVRLSVSMSRAPSSITVHFTAVYRILIGNTMLEVEPMRWSA